MTAYIASQIARSLEELSCFFLSCFILASIEYYCSASFFYTLAKCSIVFIAFFIGVNSSYQPQFLSKNKAGKSQNLSEDSTSVKLFKLFFTVEEIKNIVKQI